MAIENRPSLPTEHVAFHPERRIIFSQPIRKESIEAIKPTIKIVVHSGGEYMVVNGKRIHSNPHDSLSITAIDSIAILKLLSKSGGEEVSRKEVYKVIYGRTAPLSRYSTRLLQANTWLNKHVTYADEPVVKITKQGKENIYSIPGVDVKIDFSTKPFYEHIDTRAQSEEEIANSIIMKIRNGERIRWSNYSEKHHKAFLNILANELGKPTAMLGMRDLAKKYDLLGNHNAIGFYKYIISNFRRDQRDSVGVYLEILGIIPTTQDVIQHIISYKNSTNFWNRIPWSVQDDLTQMAAEEDNLPHCAVGHPQLLSPRKFLHGKTLTGLFINLRKHKERGENESVLKFLRRKLNLPEIPTRARYRWTRMQSNAAELELLVEQNQLVLWTEKIAELYLNSFPDLSKEHLQSEAFVGYSEGMKVAEDHMVLLQFVHEYLESYLKSALKQKYNELLILDAPLSAEEDGNELTRKEILPYKPHSQVENLGDEWERRIAQLSPLAQFLIRAAAIDGSSFDIILEEVKKKFNEDMDIDDIHEHYQDALAILRESLENGR